MGSGGRHGLDRYADVRKHEAGENGMVHLVTVAAIGGLAALPVVAATWFIQARFEPTEPQPQPAGTISKRPIAGTPVKLLHTQPRPATHRPSSNR